ncbi:MAG: hypothetical protein MI748_10575 [Opitutales bacterium]|nr:hypothetical protein [Opitutales bacterium]
MPRNSKFQNYINTLAQSKNLSEKTIAWNLNHDARISPERKRFFSLDAKKEVTCDDYSSTSSADLLNWHLRDHAQKRELKTKKGSLRHPDFCNPKVNRRNLYRIHEDLIDLAPSINLIRCVDLSSKGIQDYVIQAGIDKGIRNLQDYKLPNSRGSISPRIGVSHDPIVYLDNSLEDLRRKYRQFSPKNNTAHKETIRSNKFLNGLIEAMNDCPPFEPLWTTTARSFWNHQYSKNPQYWMQSVGVTPNLNDTWLLLFRYKRKRIFHLARPTQLDAGNSPLHFPTPASSNTGFAMECDGQSEDHDLIPEYIHNNFDLSIEDIHACVRVEGKKLIKLQKGPYSAQSRHLRLMKQRFGGLANWIKYDHPLI